MKYAPHILGAVALASIGGALSGAAIGDMRVIERGHSDTLPDARMVTAGNAALRSGERPPDHYRLVTPEGTIEVAELALHGRLRNRGDIWWDAGHDDRADAGAGYDFYETASPERIAHEERLLAFTGERAQLAAEYRSEPPAYANERGVTRAEAPMALAEPVELEAAEPPAEHTIGNAKTVNVSAALARRN